MSNLEPSSTLTESEAIPLAQAGHSDAFEFLYQTHCRRVYALCLRMAGNPTEAQDLTQDVFLQLFRKIKSFRGESSLSTWLHRLTVNVVLMRFRRKRHPEISLDEPAASGDEAIQLVEDGLIPELILSDYHLPREMTCDQVITEIETRLGFKPPTIVLASVSGIESETMRSVADRVFVKPADMDVLFRKIASLLGTQV